jgi:hypothetical protein
MTAVLRRLNYPGNCAGNLVGRVVGPNRLGEMLTIVATSYSLETEMTTAMLRHGVHHVEGAETKVGWS